VGWGSWSQEKFIAATASFGADAVSPVHGYKLPKAYRRH
jgi:hypothetical protein